MTHGTWVLGKAPWKWKPSIGGRGSCAIYCLQGAWLSVFPISSTVSKTMVGIQCWFSKWMNEWMNNPEGQNKFQLLCQIWLTVRIRKEIIRGLRGLSCTSLPCLCSQSTGAGNSSLSAYWCIGPGLGPSPTKEEKSEVGIKKMGVPSMFTCS